MIGIVAGRLAEAFHRPTVIIALGDEISQGSARSIPGFDLYEALKDCSDGLIAYGGHAAAAGLKLTRRAASRPSLAGLKNGAAAALTAEQLERVLTIDAEDSARRLEPGGRRARSKSSSRTGSPIPGRCSWRAAWRSWASPVRSAKRKTTCSFGSGRATTSPRPSPGTWPKRDETSRRARVCSVVFSAIDQRVEEPAGGSARDQGYFGRQHRV